MYIYNKILVINYAIVRCHVARRTYLPTLYKTLLFVCSFVADHRERIVEVIGDENVAALDAVITACHVLTAIIKPFVSNNP